MVLRSGHLWRLSLLVVVTLVLAWTTPSASKSSSPLSLQQDYLDTFCTPLLASSNSAVIKERKKRIDVDSDESFVHAVNLTNSKRLQRYLQHHHIHSTHLLTEETSSIAQQPHKVDKHICLLTRLTPSIYSYAKNSYFVQSIYAHLHDYLFLPLYPDTAVEDYEFHRKLQPLLEALEDIQLPCDYILWMDAGK